MSSWNFRRMFCMLISKSLMWMTNKIGPRIVHSYINFFERWRKRDSYIGTPEVRPIQWNTYFGWSDTEQCSDVVSRHFSNLSSEICHFSLHPFVTHQNVAYSSLCTGPLKNHHHIFFIKQLTDATHYKKWKTSDIIKYIRWIGNTIRNAV